MRLVLLTTDNRNQHRDYTNPSPYFGPAIAALLDGLTGLSGVEVHVVSCTRRLMSSPGKLGENVWFHSVPVPKLGWMRTLYAGTTWMTRRKLRKIRPDIVHGQGTELDCGLAASFSGYPNLLTIHGHMRRIAELTEAKPFSFYWLAARLEALALRRTSGVVCLNDYTRRRVEALNRRTWTIANAIPRPTPWPAPVTIATLLSSLPIDNPPLAG